MIITNDKHNDIPYFYRSFLPNIDSMAIEPTNPNLLRVWDLLTVVWLRSSMRFFAMDG